MHDDVAAAAAAATLVTLPLKFAEEEFIKCIVCLVLCKKHFLICYVQ